MSAPLPGPRRRWRASSLTAAAIATLIGLLPIGTLVIVGLADQWYGAALLPQRWGGRGIRRALGDPQLMTAIANSTTVAVVSVAIALALGWPAARALARGESRSLRTIMFAPLLVPPLAVGEGLSVWFLRIGISDTLFALVLAHLVTVLPYVVLALIPGFTQAVDETEQAAATLGAAAARRLITVAVPMLRRQLLLAIAFGFTVSWSQYGTSLAVGGGIPMLPVVLVPFVRSDPQIAAVLDLIFLAPPLILTAAAAAVGSPRDAARPPSPELCAYAGSDATKLLPRCAMRPSRKWKIQRNVDIDSSALPTRPNTVTRAGRSMTRTCSTVTPAASEPMNAMI